MAVIVPDDSDWLEAISRRIGEDAGTGGPNGETVSVLSAAQAKGMEYDHVLVVEPAAIADRGPAGLRRLYVALTRSTQSLTVLHTAPLPAALTGAQDAQAPAVPDPGPDDGGAGGLPGSAPMSGSKSWTGPPAAATRSSRCRR
ncbi:ATP-binding domain-containing protein [Streptomyces zhihengii]